MVVLRRFVSGLVLAAVLGAPVPTSAGSIEDCRALHAVKRKTALERWRGPRSNANKYPLHCENERMVAAVPGLRPLPPGEAAQAPAFAATTSAGAQVWRGRLSSGEDVEIERGVVRVRTVDAGLVQPLIDALRANGVVIRALRPVRHSLEDLFMQAIGDDVTPGAELRSRSTPDGKDAA